MTPFGLFLEGIRRSRGLQQNELGQRLGINPCYISSMEKGRKGPPSEDLLKKINVVLELDAEENRELRRVVEQSGQKYNMPGNAGPHEYRLVNKLWAKLGSLTEKQAQGLEIFLDMTEETTRRKYQ